MNNYHNSDHIISKVCIVSESHMVIAEYGEWMLVFSSNYSNCLGWFNCSED